MFDDLNEKEQGGQIKKEDNNTGANNAPSEISNKMQESIPPSATKPVEAFLKKEVEDMFSETDKAGFDASEKPDVFKPIEASGQIEEIEEDDGAKAQKIFVLIAIILGVALIGVGGIWAFRYFSANKIVNNENVEVEEIKEIPKIETPVEEEKEVEDVIPETPIENIDEETLTPSTTDTDQDGLTDEEEAVLGTNINDTDSDDDGLFDREEVEVYDTDPMNPDTDGDGFKDGSEVQNNYNPNGSGKLYEINKILD